MSFTFTLSQRSSVLTSNIFPPILLSDGSYEVGLLSFDSYNTIPNVDESNNKMYFGDGHIINIPTGTYEIDDLKNLLKEEFNKQKYTFHLIGNNNTLKIEIRSTAQIDFTPADSIGKLFGFTRRILKGKELHLSDHITDIFAVQHVDIQSNISSGSYINGVSSHSLHAFSMKAGPGFKIREVPNDVIYMPIDVSVLDNITLKINDQNGKLVNFQSELVTVRLHIRRVQSNNGNKFL
jgi:hypothetical protein